ncbi:inositol monophosphatase family protein [Prauserella muralis]|uniref:Inositol-1-monophosphatase n=1 Tax=Prauserella muralis TaxID=588067 RepID=A0A2V4B438_9PSEU|nr:inositol monophosphatase family protein [Prauserella muralis]PXY28148.1 inositol monophosphatase [Prauserella muralis]TWE22042.1 myo-inositol-1(or 4)-monophosphatase [Prauserella muralis]
MESAEPDLAILTETAERVATEAAELVRDARESMLAGRAVTVDTKTSTTDVVTAVDHESERLIRARLAELRPGEPVLGEEGGHEGTSGAPGTAVTWVVDPIDGTVNFLYGLPEFAVSVAAQVDGVSVAGAVVEPVSGRRWTATRGAGSWLDGRRLAVSAPERLDLALVGTGFAYVPERRARQAELVAGLLGHVRDIRRPGSAALDLCAVAAGWTDAYFEHGLHRWDWAAAALVATEAGAVVSLPGEDPELGADGTLAAAPPIAEALRAVLVKCGAGAV